MADKPDKLMIEFFAQWIRDDDLRNRVLFREKEAMKEWGLSDPQSFTLRQLEQGDIVTAMVNELVSEKDGLGINLKEILEAWVKYPSKGPGGGAAGAAYEEGSTHVRGIDPAMIKSGVESIVIVLGHGWDDSLKVVFVPPAGAQTPGNVEGKLLDMRSDVDVWQRATVKVTLPTAGKWRVMAQVAGNGAMSDSTEDVLLDVT